VNYDRKEYEAGLLKITPLPNIPATRVPPGASAPHPTDVDAVLAERGKRYGAFIKHASVAQDMKKALFHCRHRGSLAPDQVEALEMICHKMARIVNGDPNYADSWVDIAGYAKLVADRLEGVEK
jgi:hypothetical protein